MATKVHERPGLQQGIDQVERVYESLDSFVNGTAEPPLWVSLLVEFRAGLDWIRNGADDRAAVRASTLDSRLFRS